MDELIADIVTERRKSFWKPVLGILLVAVSAAVIAADIGEIMRYRNWTCWLLTRDLSTLPKYANKTAASSDEFRKLLFSGDSENGPELASKEALWRSQPNDPAYFVEYATAYKREHEKLPPDFLETARRIDPDNAWFTHLAAAVEARDCVKRKTRKGKRVDGKLVYTEPTAWEILDQARMDRAMELLHEAGRQTRCETYAAEMLQRRQTLLSHETLIDSLESYSSLGAATSFPSLSTRPLSQAIAAKAWALGEANDVTGFKELLKDANAFLVSTSAMKAGVLVDELMLGSHVFTIAENLAPAAARLGLHEEAIHWQTISDRLSKRKEARETRKFIVDGKITDSRTVVGGMIGSSLEMICRQVESPPKLTDSDLKPGRIIDHEFLSRIFACVLWMLLVMSLGLAAAYRFRVPAKLRISARGLEGRFLPVDSLWVCGAGVILPFAYVMAINRFTPLGGRDFGMQGTESLMPFAHFTGLFVLWLVVPLQLIRWRFSLRAGDAGIRNATLAGWLAVICPVAFIPVIGVAALSMTSGAPTKIASLHWTFWLALLLFAIPVIWLSQAALRAVFSRRDHLLDRAVAARLLIPAYALAMLLIISAVPFFKMSEQAWFEKETLMKPDPRFPSWSRYEYQVAVQIRKELREILGMTP